jgi:hypothetical protein
VGTIKYGRDARTKETETSPARHSIPNTLRKNRTKLRIRCEDANGEQSSNSKGKTPSDRNSGTLRRSGGDPRRCHGENSNFSGEEHELRGNCPSKHDPPTYETGEDSTGDPSVYITIFVSPEQKYSQATVSRWNSFSNILLDRLLGLRLQRYPYVRVGEKRKRQINGLARRSA